MVSSTGDGFELNYPSLPPSTGFQLTVKTNNDLTAQQVQVFHQAGKAKFVSPGAKRTEFGLGEVLWLGVIAFYLFMSYSSFRDEFKYSYLFKRYSVDVSKLLKSEKPWYIRKTDWPEVLKDLLARVISAPTSTYLAVTSSPQYLLLNSDRPTDLTESAWDELKDSAGTRLLDILKSKARQASSKAEVHDLLAVQWPAGLSETTRESAVKTLSAAYLEYLLAACSRDELVGILRSGDKPSRVSSESWDRFKGKAEAEILRSVAEKVIAGETGHIESLPEWDVLSSHSRFKLSAFKELHSKVRKAEEKLESARALNANAEALQAELSARELAAVSAERHNQELCRKVTRQLDVIDKLITDPSYIDRVEPYDDTFAPGNWALLRELVAVRA